MLRGAHVRTDKVDQFCLDHVFREPNSVRLTLMLMRSFRRSIYRNSRPILSEILACILYFNAEETRGRRNAGKQCLLSMRCRLIVA